MARALSAARHIIYVSGDNILFPLKKIVVDSRCTALHNYILIPYTSSGQLTKLSRDNLYKSRGLYTGNSLYTGFFSIPPIQNFCVWILLEAGEVLAEIGKQTAARFSERRAGYPNLSAETTTCSFDVIKRLIIVPVHGTVLTVFDIKLKPFLPRIRYAYRVTRVRTIVRLGTSFPHRDVS